MTFHCSSLLFSSSTYAAELIALANQYGVPPSFFSKFWVHAWEFPEDSPFTSGMVYIDGFKQMFQSPTHVAHRYCWEPSVSSFSLLMACTSLNSSLAQHLSLSVNMVRAQTCFVAASIHIGSNLDISIQWENGQNKLLVVCSQLLSANTKKGLGELDELKQEIQRLEWMEKAFQQAGQEEGRILLHFPCGQVFDIPKIPSICADVPLFDSRVHMNSALSMASQISGKGCTVQTVLCYPTSSLSTRASPVFHYIPEENRGLYALLIPHVGAKACPNEVYFNIIWKSNIKQKPMEQASFAIARSFVDCQNQFSRLQHNIHRREIQSLVAGSVTSILFSHWQLRQQAADICQCFAASNDEEALSRAILARFTNDNTMKDDDDDNDTLICDGEQED